MIEFAIFFFFAAVVGALSLVSPARARARARARLFRRWFIVERWKSAASSEQRAASRTKNPCSLPAARCPLPDIGAIA